MKKIISLVLACVMLASALTLVSCGNKGGKALKFGFGVSASASVTDASEDGDGEAKVTSTVAAVLVDEDGKVVKAFIDCADNSVKHTADGKAVATDSFATKYEKGESYGMVAYGGSAKEWFEQADAFCATCVGKTASEIEALVADDYKGTEEVQSAGCTIYVSDFAKAVVAAIKDAKASEATADSTLKIGVTTAQTATDATEDAKGSNKVETNYFACAVDANGKIVAAFVDTLDITFSFDLTGKADAAGAAETKYQKGDDYGMKSEYGSSREWYEHAAAFNAACVGKTVSEVKDLMGADYKGTSDLQEAGCTIYVSGFVGAAAKVK